ncbi:asparagine synthase (glutamine-hydrolysing) [Glycomyces sambucus]|uniref:asparagine synthase (glutamine-hydrolyzing) n=1 Tax=Glycomyces sambucus TaxID=380244 RepID=A0A1G9DH72_9ACTN|nr:asparagine synthase (glutamine-hydrolyzing) [Glycomyces sambucus]SDK63233.1 asparagine synthase (glutamine-hydrolysing) [Glycomyces sambucus]
MCGFVVCAGDPAEPAGGDLPALLELLDHRGPDETASDPPGRRVRMGFKRLAIIDTAGSHQPMRTGDGRLSIVFNGEIYNYLELRDELVREHGAVFATRGDTEVILAGYRHWGPDVLHRLRGMFAFVLHDAEADLLFAARDPFGIKPLYWTRRGGAVWLASEKKALPGLDRDRVDPDALAHYATFQYVPEPATLHQGVHRFEAGHSALFRPGAEPRPVRYFQPLFKPAKVTDEERLHRDIEAALRESVRLHMRSDVPVGALLSSGIDSTAVAALAREVNPGLLTFTAQFTDPGLYDELEVASQSAAQLGLANIPAPVSAEDVMRELPAIVWHLDDPVADPALVPLYFVAKKAAEHVTVALGGEGADEFFGGYTIYREPKSLKPVTALPDSAKHLLQRVSRALPEGVKGRGFLERGTAEIEERFVGNAKIFTGEAKARLLRRPGPDVREVTGPVWDESAHLDPVSRMQYLDLRTWMRGDILVKADRMSMAHSLEVRVPFLDRGVWEVASRIPAEHRLSGAQTKTAMRRALARIVPPAIVERPKLGFPTPHRQWLAGPMFDWTDQILAEAACGHLLDLDYARGLLREHRDGADHARKVWAVLVFCLWYGQIGAAPPQKSAPAIPRQLPPVTVAAGPVPPQAVAPQPVPVAGPGSPVEIVPEVVPEYVAAPQHDTPEGLVPGF